MRESRAEHQRSMAVAEDRSAQEIQAAAERAAAFRRGQAARLQDERRKLVEAVVLHLNLVPVYSLPK